MCSELQNPLFQMIFVIRYTQDESDLQELIDKVALINYELAHAMPFRRASASICEWIEMII